MKHTVLFKSAFCLLLVASMSVVVFNACKSKKKITNSKEEMTEIVQATDTTDPGVVINGVRWATRNVDIPGTFAAKPEDPGMFYQWNRKIAWPTTGSVTDWDSIIPVGNSWEIANDPSPQGWRVPTFKEIIIKLLDDKRVTNEWTVLNGVNGRKFTDKATGNSLFLPAVGYRGDDGTLINTGTGGDYWSSTVFFVANYVYGLGFWDSKTICNGYEYRAGRSIRCVTE